jgi:SAM-dependent methyltransferase
MDFQGVNVVCPACHADLARQDDSLHCARCACSYPVLHGIADLRLWPDPYISLEEDRAKGLRLARESEQLSFRDAVEHYYRITTQVPPFQATRFARSLMAAPARADAQLGQWQHMSEPITSDAFLLEIGCGTAPLLQVAAPRMARVVGVDVAFRWLVLARKRLSDAGVSVPLICACAEALPFADSLFTHVVLDSALENVRDQPLTLRECARVLRAGGHIFVATPNRASLGPDPHTGLPAGGLLPAAVTRAYVRRKGGVAPVRRLLTAGGVRRLLRASGFDQGVRIAVPDLAPAQLAGFGAGTRALLGIYRQVKRTRPGRMLLERIGPLLLAVARKSAVPDRVH